MTPDLPITPQTTMAEILRLKPEARDVLFERYHVGGCPTCSYQPEETLAQVVKRFSLPSVDDVIRTIQHEKPTPSRFSGPKLELTSAVVNQGPLPNADAVGMVGNAECGEMMTMWLKFRQEGARRVIDKASFESFGCETAIAMAARATQVLRGRTPDEALAMPVDQLVGAEEALPPIKVHCAELVEAALRAALENKTEPAPLQ